MQRRKEGDDMMILMVLRMMIVHFGDVVVFIMMEVLMQGCFMVEDILDGKARGTIHFVCVWQ